MINYFNQGMVGETAEFIRFSVKFGKNYEGFVPAKLVSEVFYSSEDTGARACINFWNDLIAQYKTLKKRKKAVKIPYVYQEEYLMYKGNILTLESIFKSIKSY